MWNYKYGRHTVGERWNQMLGFGTEPSLQVCRLCVLGAAIYTASQPTASFYIAPHIWACMFIAWYWYPS